MPNSSASQEGFININIDAFQPVNYTFPKRKCGEHNRAFQATWFKEFPWLHYKEQHDSVLCFICVQQNGKSNLRAARNKELAFTSTGFTNWKKALTRFKEHQVSECHKMAVDYQLRIPKACGNILQVSSDVAKETMEKNRRCLAKIIECLQFLARQGLTLQGDTDDESNFIQLLKLGAKDEPLLLKRLKR